MTRWEYTTNQDSFFDFCLCEYKPKVPYENKFRSVNLLYHTFEQQGIDDRIFEIIRRIRQAVGISNTIWGVKFSDNALSWEFYFLDYRKRNRERSITTLLRAIEPILPCDIPANEDLDYFQFSIDIDAVLVSQKRSIDEIHVYFANPTAWITSGASYSFTKNGGRLENFYFFFNARKHLGRIIEKIRSSAFVDPEKTDTQSILWPELMECRTICVANKPYNDGVYYSGLTVDQFLFFLEKMKYPEESISFVKDNRSRMDHLLYDVSIDYKIEGHEPVVVKSGYYGHF